MFPVFNSEGCLIPTHSDTGNTRFIRTFSKYPVSTYFVSDPVIGVNTNVSMTQQVKIHVLVQLTFQWRQTDHKQINTD